jgi:hypothetical protein
MKHKIYRDLGSNEFLLLAMALRALSTLRLNPRLTLCDASTLDQAVDYMNQSMNNFKDMCCALDLLIDEPNTSISRLLNYINLAAGEDVYQSFCDELKYMNAEQPKE